MSRSHKIAALGLGALVLAFGATPALAGKGNGNGGSASSSISLVVPSKTAAAPNEARFGSTVTFAVSTGSTSQPWVSVTCYQGAIAVYGQYWGFWSGYSPATITNAMAPGGMFTLGPTPLWSSGSANCTATLFMVSSNGKQSVLATTNFTATA